MRSTFIKEHKVCLNCLFNDRMLNKEKSKVSYRIDGCNKRQHILLHNPKYMDENKDPKKAAANEQENESKNQNSHMHDHHSFGNKFTLLLIIPLTLSYGIKNI